jgi:hypothetical protein
MSFEVLDPTYGDGADDFSPAPRLATLAGTTVGIVSNGKHGTGPFFDALERELRERHGVADVVRVVKPNYSAPAGDEIIDEARRWHALVAGIGD